MNHLIRISPIRLVGPDNEQIGVVETSEALRRAQEAGLDLVEVVPDTRPPVCKIMDYGKFKYEQSKQSRNKGAKAAEMKELRLGRSVKIDPHDVGIRINQARKFLLAGHKVQFTQRFRGREIAHKEIGLDHLKRVVEELSDLAKVEQSPRWMGKEASIIMVPDRAKVESIKRKLEKEKAARIAAGIIEPEEPELPEIDDSIDDGDEGDETETTAAPAAAAAPAAKPAAAPVPAAPVRAPAPAAPAPRPAPAPPPVAPVAAPAAPPPPRPAAAPSPARPSTPPTFTPAKPTIQGPRRA